VIDTFEGLVVFLLAFLPGAVYTWAFERIAGRWGIGLTDRLYRFVGLSAFFQVLFAPATYHLWESYVRSGAPHPLATWPTWLWGAAFGYLAVPAAIGTLVAVRFRAGGRWAKYVVGATAAPTAWDAVFSGDISGYVLLRLKSGRWIGGAYEEGSHVAGYPEPADIYLVKELIVDQGNEDFALNDDGEPLPIGAHGVLVRWSEVEYLEITAGPWESQATAAHDEEEETGEPDGTKGK
jgi:Family of unknown function (DUF6338)